MRANSGRSSVFRNGSVSLPISPESGPCKADLTAAYQDNSCFIAGIDLSVVASLHEENPDV